MDPTHSPQPGGPVLLASVPLVPSAGSSDRWGCECPTAISGECTVQVEFDAADFPFDLYCRFVRHPGGATPYTFDNMEFAPSPPGLRVGPWPGWRGIPEFPLLTLSAGDATAELRPNLYGDESTTRILRAFCTITFDRATRFTVTTQDQRLTPVKADFYRTSRIGAVPRKLQTPAAQNHGHPRLLLTPAELPELAARRSGSHAEQWKLVVEALQSWDLPFQVTATSKAFPGPQRLGNEDRLMLSALVALLDPTGPHISRALGAFQVFAADAGQPDYPPLGIDTQAGETLFQLCIGYDWLHEFMDEEGRARARTLLLRVAEICRRHLGPERRDYGQAHYLGCGLGLFAFSLLFLDDHPDTRSWAEELRGALDCALRLLPDDGAYPHGMNLWIYEFGFLLRWIEILRTATGEDLWSSLSSLVRASSFRGATLSPDCKQGITFGDPQYRTGGDAWIHFLIARRTRSGLSQWTGRSLVDLPHEGVDYRNIPPRRRAYELLYYDPEVVPRPPAPGLTEFRDTGQVFHRSEKTLFTFRAGPPLGTHRYQMGEYGGYGHSDPSSGSFLLYTGGGFLANGPGPVYRRDTALHNVVTIDGAGMVGDSTVWLPDFFPPDRLPSLPELRFDGDRSAVSWDGTSAYLPHLGLRSLHRALFIDPDSCIIGCDTVICDRERRIEWNLHSWGPFHRSDCGGRISLAMIGGARLVLLAPALSDLPRVDVETGKTEFVPAYPNDGTRDHRLRFSVRAVKATFLWALLLAPQPEPRVGTTAAGVPTITLADGTFLLATGPWLIPEAFDAPDA